MIDTVAGCNVGDKVIVGSGICKAGLFVLLVQLHARPRHLDEAGLDLKELVDAGGLQELAYHAADDETHAALGLMPVQFVMMDAEEPQTVGAAALAEFEIIGVIDGAREIRVLVIDADGQHMASAVDAARQVGPRLRHRGRRAGVRLG